MPHKIPALALAAALAFTAFLNIPAARADAAADQKTAAHDSNAFAVGLYAQLQGQDGNLFLSPESISTAMALAYAGAKGDTATEMASAMHYTLPQEQLHPALSALLHSLNTGGDTGPYKLSVANALWAQKDYPFQDDFLKITKDNYDAGMNTVDFKQDADGATKTINDWVAEKTADKIKDLIPPGVLSDATRLVITNAIYFKGTWLDPFEKDSTSDADFHLSASETASVPMMHRDGAYGYLAGDGFQALELPYKGNDLSMVVFLPKEFDGLPAFEKALTVGKLEGWLGTLSTEGHVQVSLPKFKVTAQFQLADPLKAMGMEKAFSAADADFSGMIGRRELFISAVIHKAYVDVNEEGTEAAAATAIAMAGAAAMMQAPPVFNADHPFFFIIRDNRSGSILFMGRVVNPPK